MSNQKLKLSLLKKSLSEYFDKNIDIKEDLNKDIAMIIFDNQFISRSLTMPECYQIGSLIIDKIVDKKHKCKGCKNCTCNKKNA